MLLNKERETAMLNNIAHPNGGNNGNNGININEDANESREFPTLDLLSPDFEGTRKITVKQVHYFF
jgi:hypothetical protein